MRVLQWSLVLVFTFAVVGIAQPLDDVQLSGIVHGYYGPDTTVLSNATVMIENLGTGQHDSVITNDLGFWSWTGVSNAVGEPHSPVPGNLALAPSYPNPFSETTTIRILNNSQQRVRLEVYNILGQRVAELVDDNLRPGAFDLTWNGVSRNGTPLAQGMYFLCLNAGGHAVTQKMVVLGTGSGLAKMSLRGSNPGSGGLFEPLRGSGLKGHASTLDDFLLRLEFRHTDYDSVIMNLTLADGQDTMLVTYLRRHQTPEMVLVPEGPYSMGATYRTTSQPVHTVNVPAFYLDVYEVTNSQYKAFCDSTGRTYPPDPQFTGMPNYFTDPLYANYPVVSVSWYDARAYATWKGKRLPTEAEWERAAKGNVDNRPWPWGDTWVAANANIYQNAADSFEFTSPVGHYVNGISPTGCYNMAGNVSEWCEDDWHDDYNGAPTDGSAWIDNPRGPYRIIRGGSWQGYDYSARCAERDLNEPSMQHSAIGFRCARSITINQPPLTPSSPIPTDSAINQSVTVTLAWTCNDPDNDPTTYDVYFGTASTPPLVNSSQTAATYDPDTLANNTTYYWRIVAHDNHDHSTSGPVWSFTTLMGGMVLVPAGPYTMGSSALGSTARPEHTVDIPAFYMDIYEVTNAQYRAFCDSTSRAYPSDPGFYTNYFTSPTYASYPVVMVDWNDASAYATWAGKRLPTEAEWERAAKGNTDNRLYPWGDAWVAANANVINNPADGYTYTSPVGNYPNGISPAGCYDMAGNVFEWCEDDWHSNYTGAPTDGNAWINNPRGAYRILRGGSWNVNQLNAPCAFRFFDSPTSRYNLYGFRCARTP